MGLLRSLLALSVVSAHYGLPIPLLGFVPFRGHGGFSVTIFFVLSGFYMALILEAKYARLSTSISRERGASFRRSGLGSDFRHASRC